MSEYLQKAKHYKKYPYNVLTNEMLDYLHGTALKMLGIVAKILEDNSIRYSICGGTLLGAVKSNGFIPWDDDIDIFVFEEDYSKMINCLKQAVPEWMIVQDEDTEQKYYHGWIKVRDKNSVVSPEEPLYKYNGVWIDIYKLRRIRTSFIEYEINKEHMLYLIRRYQLGGINFEELITRINKNKLIQRLTEPKNANNSVDDYRRVVWSASKVVLDEHNCDEFDTIEFDGLEVKTVKDYTSYLLTHYGEKYIDDPAEKDRYININGVEILNK